ncbi:MAG: zinc-dependent metalloprotease [Actinobacteria bacterium]|nr:zinc-dependent metalloprotease [Actinomycetota bacterium]MCA1722310.1 zinc-dependent metalloprotease [Actinomycetota bacterium]
MTRPPFGFGPSDRPDEPNDPNDPLGLAKMLGMGGSDLFAQLSQLMSWSGGPVNWDLAASMATGAAKDGDRAVTAEESRQVADACRLADLWLDPVTSMPGSGGEGRAATRVGWIESTLPAWRQLVDPVAGRVVAAMGGAMEKGLQGGFDELPEEMRGMLAGAGPLQGVMEQVGGFVFGAQVGQALGALAAEVLSSTEVGLPLGEAGRPALVPQNVAAFADGLEVPADEVRLYLALRECAHQRLFAHVPWLKAHLFDAVDAYARGIEVDPAAIEEAVGSLDPSDPESLQRALGEGLFEMQPTEVQQLALARLETALALVEGWVDAVVDAAASGPLPSAAALRETLRRRRASGGPAEQTFATLVGLQLRPRRLREAAALWSAVADARGTDGRDALWTHPDLLPSAADLDDPAAFVARTGAGGSGGASDSGTDWDAELRGLDD